MSWKFIVPSQVLVSLASFNHFQQTNYHFIMQTMRSSRLQNALSILLSYTLFGLSGAFEFPWTPNGGRQPASNVFNTISRQPPSMQDFEKLNTNTGNASTDESFERQQFQFTSNRRDEKIESVKDVDVELFGEIERALMRAAIDLEDGSLAFQEGSAEASSDGSGAEDYIVKAVQDVAQWERVLVEEQQQQQQQYQQQHQQFNGSADDPIESMAQAYQAALDAAQESIQLLTEQIHALEMELSTTRGNMQVSIRERDRLQEEYNFLAKQSLQLSHALMEIRQEQREMAMRDYPDIQQFRQ